MQRGGHYNGGQSARRSARLGLRLPIKGAEQLRRIGIVHGNLFDIFPSETSPAPRRVPRLEAAAACASSPGISKSLHKANSCNRDARAGMAPGRKQNRE